VQQEPAASTKDRQHAIRWCSVCAKSVPGAVDLVHAKRKLCEVCGEKRATRGTAAERKSRWCLSCSQKQPLPTVELNAKRCADCRERAPAWAPAAGEPATWCSACAKRHPGAVPKQYGRCEDCQVRWPAWGILEASAGASRSTGTGSGGGVEEGEADSSRRRGKPRWCSQCAKGHAGAVDVRARLCEQCGVKPRGFGLQVRLGQLCVPDPSDDNDFERRPWTACDGCELRCTCACRPTSGCAGAWTARRIIKAPST
jgi:hypothetical protein